MTAAIETWGAHTEPPKHRIETAAPILLQVAPTMTTGTWPHSFAVPLQLFADDDLPQPGDIPGGAAGAAWVFEFSQVAPTMTAGTRPHSFAVPLQLFADHNLL